MSGARQTALILLDRPGAAPAELAAALRLAGLLGGAVLEALAVRVPAVANIMLTEEVLTTERRAAWDAAEQARLAALRDACTTVPGVDLRVEEGDPAELVAAQGRSADYLVIARPEEGDTAASRAIGHAALFASGRPVLVVPPALAGTFGRNIAIAFKADGRAEKAILAALPLLRRANRIRVFGEEALPVILMEHGIALMEHGIAATPCVLPAGNFGAAVLAAMARDGDDLLVMGAYTHSTWREALLGGMTRHVLDNASVPVLMRH